MSDLGDAVRSAAENVRDFGRHLEYGDEEQPIGWLDKGEPTGADGRYIRDRLMPEFWETFARKAADYNDNENENHRALGVRGQFADIWRKIGKLKKSLWEGRSLAGEQPREILMDLIAHCFLTIAMMDGEQPPPGRLGDAPMVDGERWQGRTKPRPQGVVLETITRPDGTTERLVRGAGDQPWPMCGREKCIACTRATLRTVLQNTNNKIIKGPADGWDNKHPEPLDRGVAHSVTAASQNACPCHECVDGHA
jgi:hypothetical protein